MHDNALALTQAASALVEAVRDTAAGDAPAAAWREPDPSVVSPHREAAPPLPPVFGQFWDGWIADAADGKGAPPDFVALALLSLTGALLANHRRASPWPGWAEAPVIWAALVGNPSSGKSPALDAVTALAGELEGELNADLADRERRWAGEAKAAEVRREAWEKEVTAAAKMGTPPPLMPVDAEEPPRPERRRLVVNDATTEKLARVAAANDRALLLSRDELAGWIGNMDRYGGAGGDRALWLQAHGGRPHTIDRVKDDRPIHCASLAVAIAGCIQPDRLASMMLGGDDDGLSARFLYVWPDPRRPTRPTRVSDDAAAVGALRRLAGLPLAEGDRWTVVPLSEPAAELLQRWREFVPSLEADASGLLLSWVGKVPGLIVRLGLALEYLWWCGDRPGEPEPAEVSVAAINAAGNLVALYLLPMARRCFGDAAMPQAERDAAALARWLRGRQAMPGRVNARELRQARALPARKGDKEAERYEAALAALVEAGWLRPAPNRAGGTAGRPRKDYEVNPMLLGRTINA